jgi:hypothetical protein
LSRLLRLEVLQVLFERLLGVSGGGRDELLLLGNGLLESGLTLFGAVLEAHHRDDVLHSAAQSVPALEIEMVASQKRRDLRARVGQPVVRRPAGGPLLELVRRLLQHVVEARHHVDVGADLLLREARGRLPDGLGLLRAPGLAGEQDDSRRDHHDDDASDEPGLLHDGSV